jgi:single-strand DNA-binding protein
MSDLKLPEINEVRLAGRLTRDAELKYLPSGTAIADFSVAVSKRRKGEDGKYTEQVAFIDVAAWGKLAEFCGAQLRKGAAVYVAGELRQDSWEDRESGQKRSKTKVTASSVQTLEWPDRDDKPRRETGISGGPATDDDDGDMPF